MTDDDSTLVEINKHIKDKYNFVYFDKVRNQGIQSGFDGHIPSGDQGLEMVTIASEKQLASTCSKIVYGKSGFVKSLIADMKMDGRNFTKYLLDTEVEEKEALKYRGNKEARVEKFLQDIETLYRERAKEGGTRTTAKVAPVHVATPYLSPASSASDAASSQSTQMSTTEDEHGPLTCQSTLNGKECCVGWETNVDQWWTHHPTFEVGRSNATTQCFQEMKNADKAKYFQFIYNNQWKGGDCDRLVTSTQINSGYSAATNHLAYAFLNATLDGRPFQITRHDFHGQVDAVLLVEHVFQLDDVFVF